MRPGRDPRPAGRRAMEARGAARAPMRSREHRSLSSDRCARRTRRLVSRPLASRWISSNVLRSAHWMSSRTNRTGRSAAARRTRSATASKSSRRLVSGSSASVRGSPPTRADEVRRQASDLTAVPRDVVGQHRHRRAADVLADRFAERFVRSGDVLVARPEEHRPVVAVRDRAIADAMLVLPAPGSPPRSTVSTEPRAAPVARGVDRLGDVAAADEHAGERRRQRHRERRRRGWHVAAPRVATRGRRRSTSSWIASTFSVPRKSSLRRNCSSVPSGSCASISAADALRQQHLAAVRERPHAGGPVHCLPVVVTAALERLAGVDAHPHRDRWSRCPIARPRAVVVPRWPPRPQRSRSANTENVLSPSPLCFRSTPP